MNYHSRLAKILRVLLDNEERIREAAALNTNPILEGVEMSTDAGWCDYTKAWMLTYEYPCLDRLAMSAQLANAHNEMFGDHLYPVHVDPSCRVEQFMISTSCQMWTCGEYAEDRWTKLRYLVLYLEMTKYDLREG